MPTTVSAHPTSQPAAVPRRCDGIVAYALSDELVAYAPHSDDAYVFNTTARAVWELCNGRRTVFEIAEHLAKETGLNAEDIYEDVQGALDQFASLGLLEGATSTSSKERNGSWRIATHQ